MNRWPDCPREIHVPFLAELDAAPPGTYLASCKWNGRRRIVAIDISGRFTWRAKNMADSQSVPDALREEFEAMAWPRGCEFDMEWMGPRQKDGIHELRIFDLLMLDGVWIGDWPYWTVPKSRLNALMVIGGDVLGRRYTGPVHIEYPHQNPGLVEMFNAQVTNERSEGLVIRSADQKHTGSLKGCADAKTGFWKCKHKVIVEK